jgi:hypothetical protein
VKVDLFLICVQHSVVAVLYKVIVMPCLCHPATKRGDRKPIVSQYSQFKDGRLIKKAANIQGEYKLSEDFAKQYL